MTTNQIDLPSLMRPEKDPSWRKQAKCVGTDTNGFFGERGQNDYSHQRLLCASCPVQNPCLQFALDNSPRDGFFGGFTPKERRRLTKATHIPVSAVVDSFRKIDRTRPAIVETAKLLKITPTEVRELIAKERKTRASK